ncbi:MAG TPA: trehalase family glycosidase, partial [Cytophagaceae bacterium]
MKVKVIILSLVLFPFFSFCQKKIDFSPKYEAQWSQVNDTIKANWKNYSGDCGEFPDTFAFAMWCGIQFYWDTYFTQLGLLSHNEVALAKGGANNLIWMMDKYKFIPNANADWGDNRSQPPYLSMIVKDLYPQLKDTVWLRNAYSYLLKEYDFWTNPNNTVEDNSTPIDGLQRYFHHATNEEL